MGLIDQDEHPVFEALTGGVSSLVLRADTRRGSVCVKQALQRLRVAGHWEASRQRSAAEVGWLRLASGIIPGMVPQLIGEDPSSYTFAMEFISPGRATNWKTQLMDGMTDLNTSQRVAVAIGSVHRATALKPNVAHAFANSANFFDLRLKPYFETTGHRHSRLRSFFASVIQRTLETELALVHGDVSPKNILVTADGPILLDAECATFGDPAFDLAFCLNHLILKSFFRQSLLDRYVALFDGMSEAYQPHITWERIDKFDERCASLLAALLLARIDGLSPVEYLTDEPTRERVRQLAIGLIDSGISRTLHVRKRWLECFEGRAEC